MNTITNTEVNTGSVVSADGTDIGYLTVGQGPGVVILHGSMESARSHLQMAAALQDAFTVYLPDRRGRGLSGPYPANYGVRTEVEDLAAVITATGADMVFGVSSSGLVVLEAARTNPAIRKAAVYEPALLPADARQTRWLPRFDREMAAGDVASALVTSMFGLELAPAAMKVMPQRLLAALTGMMMRAEDRKAAHGTATMRSLAPTLHYEGALLAEMAGTMSTFAAVKADVLLLSGGKGLKFLRPALADLELTLPHCRRVDFAGLDHGGSADVSSANRGGKPEIVASELRSFLAE
ncbi:MAG: alpha/beta fold hydrolase [Streptosporangiaceae bacterium]